MPKTFDIENCSYYLRYPQGKHWPGRVRCYFNIVNDRVVNFLIVCHLWDGRMIGVSDKNTNKQELLRPKGVSITMGDPPRHLMVISLLIVQSSFIL